MALPLIARSPHPLARRLLWRGVLLAVMSLAIALLLTAMDGRGFWPKLVYSLCIGGCCWTLTELQRHGLTLLLRRLRPGTGVARPGVAATLPMLLVGVVLGAPLGLSIADALTGLRSPSLLQWDSGTTRITLAVTLLAAGVVMGVTVLLERLANARAASEAAQRLASENQLRALQAQLEPHMLFNTLANLRVLIGVDPPQAQAMLDRLIAFLRVTLEASRAGEHTLAREFAHLADYLALLQMRMGPRLQVHLELPRELEHQPLPALLLQPLVENAIRHGLEPKIEGGTIHVSAVRDGARVLLRVRDTGVGLDAGSAAASAGTHFGLQQVRQRLQALFGRQASLHIADATDDRGGVQATVVLPLPTGR